MSAFAFPPEQVGPIVTALGATRDLREPEEIFSGILDEGDEVTLVSGLKLKRGFLHREPVIELCGADPYKFVELRQLGLINEQVDWKQRFFVPTDEEAGIAIVADLLTRYPILAPTDAENELTETNAAPETIPPQVVELDTWIVAVRQAEPECQPWHSGTKSEPGEESATFALTPPPISVPASNGNGAAQLALDFGLVSHE